MRPRRIGIPAVGRDAREAGGASGNHEGPDLRRRPGEDQRHVRDVLTDERGHPARLDDVVREDDDGSGIRNRLVRRAEPW